MVTAILSISCLLSILILQIQAAPAHKLENITIEVPSGTTNHGDPHILCTPTKPSDVAIFYLTNYIAHAATVPTLPGQQTVSAVLDMVVALLFPISGVIKAVQAISRKAIFCKTPLETALKAGAVCEVVRTSSWKPKLGDKVNDVRLMLQDDPESTCREVTHADDVEFSPGASKDDQDRRPTSLIVQSRDLVFPGFYYFHSADEKTSLLHHKRNVYGRCDLPDGYALRVVADDQRIVPAKEELPFGPSLTSSLSKGLVAIVQLLFASYTLAETNRTQLSRYGYASFGLTVSPYLIMSFLNLLSSFLCPTYSHVYLVDSEIMVEARDRDGHFEGMIGTLKRSKRSPNSIDVEFTNDPDHLMVKPLDDIGRARMELRFGSVVGNGYTLDNLDTPPALPYYILMPNPATSYMDDPSTFTLAKAAWPFLCALPFGCLPIAIVGIFSKFRPAESTVAERVLTMAWLISSTFLGQLYAAVVLYLPPIQYLPTDAVPRGARRYVMVVVCLLGVCAYGLTPVFGGFVVVGRMLLEYGTCQELY